MSKKNHNRPPNMVTRGQAAKILGVSLSTVRRMEGNELHPEIEPDDTRVFEVAEVERVAATRRASCSSAQTGPAGDISDEPAAQTTDSEGNKLNEGQLAALIFQDLEDGYLASDIVRRRELPPDVVTRIHAQWCKFRSLETNAPGLSEEVMLLIKRVEALEAKLDDLVRRVDSMPSSRRFHVLEWNAFGAFQSHEYSIGQVFRELRLLETGVLQCSTIVTELAKSQGN